MPRAAQKVGGRRAADAAPARKRAPTRTKEAILRAATELFAQRGFDGVSLDDIATLSRTNRSLILYYFATKEDLWKSAALAVVEDFNAKMKKRLSALEGLPDAEFREKSARIWMSGWIDMPEVAQFLVREGGRPSPRLNWLVEAVGVPAMDVDMIDRARRNSPVVRRACYLSVCLAVAALGPLLEAKMNAASGQLASGIWPLSKKGREEILDVLLRMSGD